MDPSFLVSGPPPCRNLGMNAFPAVVFVVARFCAICRRSYICIRLSPNLLHPPAELVLTALYLLLYSAMIHGVFLVLSFCT